MVCFYHFFYYINLRLHSYSVVSNNNRYFIYKRNLVLPCVKAVHKTLSLSHANVLLSLSDDIIPTSINYLQAPNCIYQIKLKENKTLISPQQQLHPAAAK